jgi:hypothetical protein
MQLSFSPFKLAHPFLPTMMVLVVHGNAERESALAVAVDRPIDSKKPLC